MKTWRELRIERGISRIFVAKLLGISSQAVSNKELGKSDFSVKEAKILLDLYNVNLNDVAL